MEVSRVMYSVKPIFQLPHEIDLPTCMYHMKSILSTKVNREANGSNEILNLITDKKSLPELRALEKRWDNVLNELNDLVAQVKTIKQSIGCISSTISSQHKLDEKALEGLKVFNGAVIKADPRKPLYSLFLIKKVCENFADFSSYVHSSVSSLPEELTICSQSLTKQDLMKISLIWKEGLNDAELILHPVKQVPIRGEVNILRYLGRAGMDFLQYPLGDAYQTTQVDSVLDDCHRLQHTDEQKEMVSLCRSLSAKLGKNPYFGGDKFNIADVALWSTLKQIPVNVNNDLTPNISKWFNRLDALYYS